MESGCDGALILAPGIMYGLRSSTQIILNPGKTPIEEYYELADQIVTFEDPFSDFE